MNRNRLKYRRQSESAAMAEGVDYSSMAWGELRELAKEKGVNTFGMKRADVEAALNER